MLYAQKDCTPIYIVSDIHCIKSILIYDKIQARSKTACSAGIKVSFYTYVLWVLTIRFSVISSLPQIDIGFALAKSFIILDFSAFFLATSTSGVTPSSANLLRRWGESIVEDTTSSLCARAIWRRQVIFRETNPVCDKWRLSYEYIYCQK